MGVERRNHESSTRDRNDQIDIRRLKAGTLEAFLGCFAAEFNGVFYVLFIRLREGPGLDGVFDGENSVTIVNAGIVHNTHHGLELTLGNIEDAAHVIFHVVATNRVGWKRRRRCGDGAIFRTRALLFGVR
jgi:hypothetical protein